MRILGLASTLPSTSYFSNYEVFLAERRVKEGMQLVKLVYVFLPYQRRLWEYGMNNSKVFKLRVTRDHSCDETFAQVNGFDSDQPRSAALPPALNSTDPNRMLACYRTTADDYRDAISRAH